MERIGFSREVVVERIGRLKPMEGVEEGGHKVEVEAMTPPRL
jgi:hypothetical protein